MIDLRSEFSALQKSSKRELAQTIQRLKEDSRDKYYQELDFLSHRYSNSLKAVRNSSSQILVNKIGVVTKELNTHSEQLLREEIVFFEGEIKNLKIRINAMSTENAYHIEAVRVLGEQLTIAQQLLTKNKIDFKLPNVTPMLVQGIYSQQIKINFYNIF